MSEQETILVRFAKKPIMPPDFLQAIKDGTIDQFDLDIIILLPVAFWIGYQREHERTVDQLIKQLKTDTEPSIVVDANREND